MTNKNTENSQINWIFNHFFYSTIDFLITGSNWIIIILGEKWKIVYFLIYQILSMSMAEYWIQKFQITKEGSIISCIISLFPSWMFPIECIYVSRFTIRTKAISLSLISMHTISCDFVSKYLNKSYGRVRVQIACHSTVTIVKKTEKKHIFKLANLICSSNHVPLNKIT